MFETDTAILLNDGKYSMSTSKKVIVCCSVIICFGCLYFILANLHYQKEFLTQNANDSRKKENVTYIPRIDWEPRTRKVNIPAMTQPASYVVISHTNTSDCTDLMSCKNIVLSIRNKHIIDERNVDVWYNFFIGSFDGIFVGRGWDLQPDSCCNYKNSSISVALIGNFNNMHPTDLQLDNLRRLIQDGIKAGKIYKNYKLLGQKQFDNTDSPGRILYDIIKQWEHWSPI